MIKNLFSKKNTTITGIIYNVYLFLFHFENPKSNLSNENVISSIEEECDKQCIFITFAQLLNEKRITHSLTCILPHMPIIPPKLHHAPRRNLNAF